ncbi:MAG: 50S ribosomal protein L13 [Oligoflexia bacterium]|nr:50S ribosomal protein L13 [Oligoflexia bacterium]
MKLTKTTKTFNNIEIKPQWLVIDASDKVLGRLASRVANILRGKSKPQYTPNTDCGDYVVIINAEKIKLTGKKLSNKKYYHHSGYVNGFKEVSASVQMDKNPEKLFYDTVKGMLPKSKLSDKVIGKLKVYRGEAHPHVAQKPTLLAEESN